MSSNSSAPKVDGGLDQRLLDLERQLVEHQARAVSTSEILRAIEDSNGDIQPVFDRIARSAAELCAARFCMLWRYDGKLVHYCSSHGFPAAFMRDYIADYPKAPTEGGIVKPTVTSGRIAHIEDALSDDYPDNKTARTFGYRRMTAVPIQSGNQVWGAIVLGWPTTEALSPSHIGLIQSFAEQASIAIENARLFHELQSRLEREAATRDILEVISQSRDDDGPVFDAILRNAARLCHSPMAWLLLVDDAQTTLTLAGYHGDSRRVVEIGDAWPLNRDVDIQTGLGIAILEARTVLDEDMALTPHYLQGDATMRQMVDEEGLRTRVSVPLVSGGRAIGAIILSRREVIPFGTEDLTLIDTFAEQAVIAIENVRQFRELQTRLVREAATRETLEVISRSRDDEDPVFEVVLRKATQLCGASFASLWIVREDRREAFIAAEWGEMARQFNAGSTVWPLESHSAPTTCMREGRIVHIPDLADTDIYRSGDAVRVTAVDVEGVRTCLSVPLNSGDRTIGCIDVYRREIKPFTADEIALVETFAAQAVIAIENVRQFRELQDSLEKQEATSDILRVISQSREDDLRVFDLVVEKAAVLCDADQGSLQIVNEARTHIRLMADWGHDRTAFRPGLEFSLDQPLSILPTIRSAKVVHIEDYAQSDAYRDRHPIAVELIETEGIRTRLIVPLLQNGIAIGCISLSRRTVRPFSQPEIQIVETFAAQAVIAIENVRQFRELQTRLAREAATREILEVISQSRDDDAPVFDAVLRNANRLCGTSMAYLVLGRPDDAHMTLAAYVNPHLPSDDSVDEIIAFANRTGMRMDAAEHFSAQAIISGEVVQIADVATAQGYLSGEPTVRILVEDVGVHTVLSVPLFDAQGAIGAISLQRREELLFSDDEITLIQSFAAQAVIAIENVRQFRELQFRLEREKASVEILEIISHSRDDETPVFDAILARAERLCNAPSSALLLTNEARDRLVLMATRGMRSSIDIGESHPITSGHTSSDAVLTGATAHVHDVRETELYRNGDPLRIEMVEKWGLRTSLAVPLIHHGRAIGALTVMRLHEVKPFSDDDVSLLEGFAAQAVIAIENARQFSELQTRLERERASAEILEVISHSRDDDKPVFDVVLRKAAELCHAPMSSLLTISEDRRHALLTADWGLEGIQGGLVVGAQRWSLDSDGALSTCMLEGRIAHVHDLADTGDYRSGHRTMVTAVDVEGIRTLLAVPLFSGGGTVGCILVLRPEVRPFAADEIALVETFAAQAVIAIENVRQFRELQKRLAREAATREILEVISQSRDDERPVFDVVLRKAAELCGASMASLIHVSEDRTQAVAFAEWGDHVQDQRPVGVAAWPMESEYAPATCLREGRIVHIPDLADTDLYRSGDKIRVTAVDVEGIHTFLSVPLFSGGMTVSCLSIYRKEVRPFNDDEIALVETFAAQAVIAIENVRQFRELQDRLAREAATRDVLRVISESPDDEQPTFEVILDNATRLCGTKYASLVLGRRGDASQRMVAHRAAIAETIAIYNEGKVRMDPQDSIGARAILEGITIHVPDMADTGQYRDGHERFRMVVDQQGLRTNLFVPLMGPEGGIGCFILWKKEVAPFTADQIALMETFASHAVIAIENVRQFKALEALNAELGDRVQDQVGEIERMGRLKRFLPAAVADTVISSGSEKMLSSHRALLGVLFCDIRGFTAFCETAEPEETIEVLQTYHEEMGKLINAHGAGVDHRMGDGIMVLFNDPLPCDDPAGEAVRLAIAMHKRMGELSQKWKRLGHRLGFGVGISLGYATVGMVGFEGRFDYTASGTAINLASRLCDEALDGEVLLSPRAGIAVEDRFQIEPRGEFTLKGIREPVEVFRLAGLI